MQPTVMQTPHAVGILGGMGPAAGADFVRLFVQACTSYLQEQGAQVNDQAYPEHWLVQMPIPDRSSAIGQAAGAVGDPAPYMLQGVGRLAALGVRSIAVACNTAHVWHGQLQTHFPHLQVLHIAQETAQHVQALGAQQAIVLATAGTYRTGLYSDALRACGVNALVPDEAGVQRLMQGIYEGVKQGQLALATAQFGAVLETMLQRYGPVPVIMGCTEIPLALPQAPQAQGVQLIDPAWILAQALSRCAYEGVHVPPLTIPASRDVGGAVQGHMH